MSFRYTLSLDVSSIEVIVEADEALDTDQLEAAIADNLWISSNQMAAAIKKGFDDLITCVDIDLSMADVSAETQDTESFD